MSCTMSFHGQCALFDDDLDSRLRTLQYHVYAADGVVFHLTVDIICSNSNYSLLQDTLVFSMFLADSLYWSCLLNGLCHSLVPLRRTQSVPPEYAIPPLAHHWPIILYMATREQADFADGSALTMSCAQNSGDT